MDYLKSKLISDIALIYGVFGVLLSAFEGVFLAKIFAASHCKLNFHESLTTLIQKLDKISSNNMNSVIDKGLTFFIISFFFCFLMIQYWYIDGLLDKLSAAPKQGTLMSYIKYAVFFLLILIISIMLLLSPTFLVQDWNGMTFLGIFFTAMIFTIGISFIYRFNIYQRLVGGNI
jgi:hypothetical protein